jgi:hypothetical protein
LTLAGGESERSETKRGDSRGVSPGANQVMMTANTLSEDPLDRFGLTLRHYAIHPPIQAVAHTPEANAW